MNSNTPRAIALQWDGTTTPTVTAKAEGELALEIIAMAKELGIPLQEEPQLAAALSQLELGEEIPEMLYRAVAEVIAFAYFLSERTSVTQGSNV
ncbi:MAG TPA: flagellar protein FhlB [Candidatus Tenderia sp.]|nr:flagellar protein FhlB [Candidatus Tenderia sp.]